MLSDTPRRIAIITGTRAEWGLLSPVAKALDAMPGAKPLVIATNMHLMERYGHTVDEIMADGLEISARVPMPDGDGSPRSTVDAMAVCMTGMAGAYTDLRPDLAVILGDRFEMLAAATAAMMMNIPIAHIAGGETTLGAIDDRIRHAITKMASIHLTETEAYRRRVIEMGENPARVINAGALGVYNALHEPVMGREELARSIGLTLERPTLLVTYHAATADAADPKVQFGALLAALDRQPQTDVIITYPNNDPRGEGLIEMIHSWAEANCGRAVAIPSLGKRRYLSALRYVSAVVGNSSSGIIEVPSMHIPTVNIGTRQQGRIAAASVISCDADTESIDRAITFALSPDGRRMAMEATNPYARPDTIELITDALACMPL